MPDLGDILNSLFGNNPTPSHYEDVATLSESEADEWRSIDVEAQRLNKLLDSIMEDRKVVEARLTIFWSKIKRNYHIDTDNLPLKIHNEEGVVIIQKALPENDNGLPQ